MLKNLLLLLLFTNTLLSSNIKFSYTKNIVFGKQFKDQKIIHMFSLDKPANVEFQMKYSEPSTKPNSFVFEIYDENGQKGHQFLRIFPDTNKPTKLNLPLQVGLYQIFMFSNKYINKPFELTINKTTGNFEQEPNDTFSQATPIQENKPYNGYIQRKDGIKLFDYYKLTIDKKSKLNITFKANEQCNEKNGYLGYKFAVFDGDMSKGEYAKQNYPLFEEINSKQETMKSFEADAGDYYIRVKLKSSTSFNKCDWNRSYSIKYISEPL